MFAPTSELDAGVISVGVPAARALPAWTASNCGERQHG